MRFRKLRVAWSAFWGLACVLLIVLWVRSYWVADWLLGGSVNVMSARGHLRFRDTYNMNNAQPQLVSAGINRILPFTNLHFRSYDPDAMLPVNVGKTIPDWPFATALIVLSASAWIPLSWQFSLRTLLIATTLVAVVLGLIVAAPRWPAN